MGQTSRYNTESCINIADMDVAPFIARIDHLCSFSILPITDRESADSAASAASDIANTLAFLTSIVNAIVYRKRQLKRGGNVGEYEDMIDKEKILSNSMRSLERQHETLRMTLSLYKSNSWHDAADQRSVS